MNVEHTPLAEPHKIIIPTLRIKPGLVKSLVKPMDKNEPAFKYPHKKFPRHRVAKIKDCVFVGHQIKQLFKDPKFQKLLRSKANVFIRTLPTWKNGTRGIGPRQCWLTTVGSSSKILPTSITSNRPKEIESPKQIKVFLTCIIIYVHIYTFLNNAYALQNTVANSAVSLSYS
ncbi:hypothetical protein AVEN_150903-1 [Araneus ventricosus]|uniref:Uncharacterized protein n=1 Tax=Araneus ventricosus TaxID=182803 RepID=A0A4Y2CBP6_ARAVE|nr:hypothetical protein AVEN_150903-1 [Araneus ventricosus]